MRSTRENFSLVRLSNIREHGCCSLLVYCGALDCNHSAQLNADHLPDDTPIRPLGRRMVCGHCGHRGAVRAIPRSSRAAALLLRQMRPSSRKRVKLSIRLSM
jgi:hypothetical protein